MWYKLVPYTVWTDPVTSPRRSSAVFKAGWQDTLDLLADEIRHLKGRDPVIIQIDVRDGDVRRDGMLRAGAKVGQPGVVISFESKYGPLRYATDVYEQQWSGALPGWQANIRAIALALQALRAVDRYGVTRRGEQYTGWTALPAGSGGVLGLFSTADDALRWMRGSADVAGIRHVDLSPAELYRRLARVMHPDVGGSQELWARLDAARLMLESASRL